MTVYELNLAKLQELLPNCKARAIAWMDQCYALGYDFRISEAYRPRERQIALFTQGRTVQDINSMKRLFSANDYLALFKLYEQGKNLKGPQVTWTLSSVHSERRAIDVLPISGSQRLALAAIANIGARYGVYRPASTLAMGDYGHIEIVDLPLPLPRPTVAARLADRLAQLQQKAQNSTVTF